MSVVQWVGVALIAIGLILLVVQILSPQPERKERAEGALFNVKVSGPVGLLVVIIGGLLVALPLLLPGNTPPAAQSTTKPSEVAASPSASPVVSQVDSTCRDTLDLAGVTPGMRYTVKSPLNIMGDDVWLNDPRQVWIFVTGADGTVYTYGIPSQRTVTNDKSRHIWGAWGMPIGAEGNWTVNVRLLSKNAGDALAKQVKNTGQFKQAIPAGAETVADIDIVKTAGC